MQHFQPFDYSESDAVTNMALDACLFDTAQLHATAGLRFYGWSTPTATFGYSQKFAHLPIPPQLKPASIRRLTGGGIVFHGTDLTYALALPSTNPFARVSARDLYSTIHSAIKNTLIGLGQPAELAPCRQCDAAGTAAPETCFPKPQGLDVILPNGKKIAGAAMRRRKDAILVQGSIRVPPQLSVNALQRALETDLHKAFAIRTDANLKVDPLRLNHWKAYFADPTWNQKR